MKLKIKFPDHTEAVGAVPDGDNFRLTQHAYFVPLAPGDIVTAEDGWITGVVSQEPVFMVQAYFPINTPPEYVRAKCAEWQTATDVTRATALTALITSQSHQWLKDVIEPEVWWVELLRVPGAVVDIKEALT